MVVVARTVPAGNPNPKRMTCTPDPIKLTLSLIASRFIFFFSSGSFDCIEDDVEARDLSVSFSNADTGEILYEAPTGSREGIFQLDKLVGGTRYALCFQNNESNDDQENEFDVGFSIHMMKAPRTLPEGEIGPDNERAMKLVSRAARIHQDWANLMDHYDYVRNREAVHERMNDAILVRLTRWTFFEAFLVIGMATGQVMYWKRFFETRRYL